MPKKTIKVTEETSNAAESKPIRKVTPTAELEKVDHAHPAIDDTLPKEANFDNGTQTFHDTKIEKVTAPRIRQGAEEMDNAQPKDEYHDNIETSVVAREVRVIREGLTRKQMQDYMDDLEKTRPAVFADRKEDLERQLANLKD